MGGCLKTLGDVSKREDTLRCAKPGGENALHRTEILLSFSLPCEELALHFSIKPYLVFSRFSCTRLHERSPMRFGFNRASECCLVQRERKC